MEWILQGIIILLLTVLGVLITKLYDKVETTHDFVITQDEKNSNTKEKLDDHEKRIITLEDFREDVKKFHYKQHGELI